MIARTALLHGGRACTVCAICLCLGGLLCGLDADAILRTREHREALRERDRLEVEGRLILENVATTERVMKSLVEGQLSLREAVALLRAGDARLPVGRRRRSEFFQGQTEHERCCHAILFYVERMTLDRATRRQALARLEAELRDHLASRKQPLGPSAKAGCGQHALPLPPIHVQLP